MSKGYATAVKDAMAAKGYNILDLSTKLESAYEHIRKLTLGLAFPSRHLNVRICKILGLDAEDAWNLVVADQIAKKYGSRPDLDPRAVEMEPILRSLTAGQYRTILAFAQGLVAQNREVKK
jgi:hypothetical protein